MNTQECKRLTKKYTKLIIGVVVCFPVVGVAAYISAGISDSHNISNTSNILDENYGTYATASNGSVGSDSDCPPDGYRVVLGTPPFTWTACRLALGGTNYDFNAWVSLSSNVAWSQSAGTTVESGGSGGAVTAMFFTRTAGNPFGSSAWVYKGEVALSSFFPDAYESYTLGATSVWCMPTWPYTCFPYYGQILIARKSSGTSSTRELRVVEID